MCKNSPDEENIFKSNLAPSLLSVDLPVLTAMVAVSLFRRKIQHDPK
jgi:hypothetical protein